MAQLNFETIKHIEKERNTIHSKVDATYSVFEVGGEKFLQIDTYGRGDRENPGKISQSIQIDREAAEFLIRLFMKEFS